MKYILSVLLLSSTMATAVAQTSAQKARQKEIQTAYSQAMEGIKQQAANVDPVENITATKKRMEAAVGVVTYRDEFYTMLPDELSFFRRKRSMKIRPASETTSTEALFNNNGRVIFCFEKEGSEEKRIYWNNDGSLSMTLKKANAKSKQEIDKLDSEYINETKKDLEREYSNYKKLLEDGLNEEAY